MSENEKQGLLTGPQSQVPGYGAPPPSGYPPQGAPPQGYPGQAPPQGYQGQAPPQGYPGQAPPQGYPGQAPPQGYQGGPPPQGGYPPQGAPAGAVPPAAGQVEQDSIPSAPPIEKMDQIAGYENVASQDPLPPPSYEEVTRAPPPTDRQIPSASVITAEQAKEAYIDFTSEHCCYGSSGAKDSSIVDLKSSSAFHYTLETFGEKRVTTWAQEPYNGQPIDGPQNGPAPGPWDLQVMASKNFQNSKSDIEVPHTASVKPCHTCVGNCRVRCNHCHGRGNNRCTWCHGNGHNRVYEDGRHHNKPCHHCNRSGQQRCNWCHGHGQVKCKTCDGKGNLKCYIKLTVTWTNHYDDHIVERTALPSELIRGVNGQTAFEEELPRVWAINHFPDPTINQASDTLVKRHSTAFPTERLLIQRHRVRIIPVNEVIAIWKNQETKFYVYGFENKVYAPDYPQKCCCTIL
ncbi:unnamed protein product [Owenia fusiformis]|uniref:Protein SSUH2 homolog n=1 Tax=Owenia fusiformis TaxID=6347 RepID=A0A8S4NP11_OWEFU|nr:unnamed protein product [Owenia fusiformis]